MTAELRTYWLPSLDIPTVLHPVMSAVSDARQAVISRIDSTPGVASLESVRRLLESLGASYENVGGDVVVDVSVLVAAVEGHDFLTGFDEVWLCMDVPRSERPPNLEITSDVPFVDRAPAGLSEWMLEVGCRVGLGDGDGLNVATFDPHLARLIQAIGDDG
jgi:hypothetical protein